MDPPESNSPPVGWADAEALAEALLLGDALLVVVVLLGGALLVAAGEALLVPVGDIVVVSCAAAGVLGCISASQLRRNVRPAASTITITAIFTNVVVLAMMSSVAASSWPRFVRPYGVGARPI